MKASRLNDDSGCASPGAVGWQVGNDVPLQIMCWATGGPVTRGKVFPVEFALVTARVAGALFTEESMGQFLHGISRLGA